MKKIPPKIERFLREGMAAFGHAVEFTLEKSREVKSSLATKGKVEPILAIEGQFSVGKIRELIFVCVNEIVVPLLPKLVDKSALEMGSGEVLFSGAMREKGAAFCTYVDIGGSAGSYPALKRVGEISYLQAASISLPFEAGFFDFAVANLATPDQGDITASIAELGRAIAPNGTAVIVDFHPFGRFAKRGRGHLRAAESPVRGIEDYYKICRSAGFHLEGIRESFIDEKVRSLFITPEEKSAFRSAKETPFLIFLSVTKKWR